MCRPATCHRRPAVYPDPMMTDSDRIEALLDIVDPDRTAGHDRSAQLVVLGYAERVGRAGFRPTNAGWTLLGDKGRAFDAS